MKWNELTRSETPLNWKAILERCCINPSKGLTLEQITPRYTMTEKNNNDEQNISSVTPYAFGETPESTEDNNKIDEDVTDMDATIEEDDDDVDDDSSSEDEIESES